MGTEKKEKGKRALGRGYKPEGSPAALPGASLPAGEAPRRIEYMALDKLHPAKRNAKDHDIGLISTSIATFRYSGAMILDERTGRLNAGHGRAESLLKLRASGAPAPEGIQVADGNRWFVPVERGWASKDDEEAEAAAIARDRSAESGGWTDQLSPMLRDVASHTDGARLLAATGYDQDDLDKMLRDVDDAANLRPGDDQWKEPVEPWVKPGDLYQLGDHLVLCADSTEQDEKTSAFVNMDRLLGAEQAATMICDPPYAIFGSSTGVNSNIADDKMVLAFFEKVAALAMAKVRWFGQVYMFADWRSWAAMWISANRRQLAPKNMIVWDKEGAGLGSNWRNTHELIGYFAKEPQQTTMRSSKGNRLRPVKKANILRYPRPVGEEREHNAAKPVAALEELVDASTEPGEIVLDPFLGSGSTLIATERKKRRCFGCDVMPKWVQVTVERWQRITGKKAVKLER